MHAFDIVLIDDQSMDFVNEILRFILYDSNKSQEEKKQKVSIDN